ncbi:MAG: hypothetical protein K8S15_10465 [Candidatus Aegiribacteria sp.]|nr:hypothetical protein [Candidatus Aegiribacteria sp.]
MSQQYKTPANAFFAQLNDLMDKNPDASKFLVSKKMASELVSMNRDDWMEAGCTPATAGDRLRLFTDYGNEGINHMRIGSISFELSNEFEHPIKVIS